MSGRATRDHLRVFWLVLAFALLAAAAGAGRRAEAAFPGANGKIVFGSQHAGEDEIWVMNADGTNKHNLTRHDGAKISDIDPVWSPDGRQIAFSSDPAGNRQIWVMSADGSSAHAVTNTPGFNRLPSWTADGKSIVFMSRNGTNAEIERVRLADGQVTNLTNDPAFDYSPAASPRGNKVVFSSDRDGKGHLYVLADGTVQRITTGDGYDYFPNWSPRGNDIVFTRETPTEAHLYLVHADGTGEHALTSGAGNLDYFPAFSPDGTKVVYSACTFTDGELLPNFHCKLHTINLDGTGDTNLGFPAISFPVSETFDDNTRNVDLWSIIHDGVGGTIQWTNGELEMSIAGDGTSTDGSPIGVHVGANCVLNGDFDAQVDYRLLTWPPGDNVNVEMQAYPGVAGIARSSQGSAASPVDSYNTWVDSSAGGWTPTSDESGSLRIVRGGDTVTSYYRSGGSWVPFATGTAPTAPTLILLVFKSYGDFGHQAAKVVFDNFSLTGTNVDCSDIRPNYHPDWGVAPR